MCQLVFGFIWVIIIILTATVICTEKSNGNTNIEALFVLLKNIRKSWIKLYRNYKKKNKGNLYLQNATGSGSIEKSKVSELKNDFAGVVQW